MTVSTTTNKVRINGNGITTSFPFQFPILKNDFSDLKVYRIDINEETQEETETLLSITTNYTVTVTKNLEQRITSGYINLINENNEPLALTENQALFIMREEEITQDLDLYENQKFPYKNLENMLDKIIVINQQQQEQIDRTLKTSSFFTGSLSETITSPVENRSLKWKKKQDGTFYVSNSDTDVDEVYNQIVNNPNVIAVGQNINNVNISANNINSINAVAPNIASVNNVAGNITALNSINNWISTSGGAVNYYIGQIIQVLCGSTYVPAGCLPCNGAEYSSAQFTDLWNNYLRSNEYYTKTVYYANYNVTGSPTINDYVVSNIDKNNYVSFVLPSFAGKIWFYVEKITTTNISTKQAIGGFGNIISSNNQFMFALDINANGTLGLFVSSNGTSYNIANGTASTLILTANTPYYIKTSFTGTAYTVDVSTIGAFAGEEQNYITVASTTEIFNPTSTVYADIGVLTGSSSSALIGSVDLKESYLSIDNQVYWSCSKQEQVEKTLLGTCSYEEYQQNITTYGQCPLFAVDTTNNKFKTPTIKDGSYITQAKSDTELGKIYNESLPNITASANVAQGSSRSYNATGAFYQTNDGNGGNWDSAASCKLRLDASRISSTYQDDAKVQGDNVRARFFVVIANGEINQSVMDWSAWATGLNTKANTDLSNTTSNIDYIIESNYDSTNGNWYEKYKSGKIRQGGLTAVNVNVSVINFQVPFQTAIYKYYS